MDPHPPSFYKDCQGSFSGTQEMKGMWAIGLTSRTLNIVLKTMLKFPAFQIIEYLHRIFLLQCISGISSTNMQVPVTIQYPHCCTNNKSSSGPFLLHIMLSSSRFAGNSTKPSTICQKFSASMFMTLAEYSICSSDLHLVTTLKF